MIYDIRNYTPYIYTYGSGQPYIWYICIYEIRCTVTHSWFCKLLYRQAFWFVSTLTLSFFLLQGKATFGCLTGVCISVCIFVITMFIVVALWGIYCDVTLTLSWLQGYNRGLQPGCWLIGCWLNVCVFMCAIPYVSGVTWCCLST